MFTSNSKLISITALILLSVMIFTACAAGTSDGKTTESTDSGSDAVESETTAVAITPELPDRNMEGRTFTFLTCNWPGEAVWTMNEITIDEQNGNAVNDAFYIRNSNVQEKYNCVIAEHNIDYYGDAVTALRNSISAGDNAFDIFIPRMQALTTLVVEGLIHDLNNFEYLDFSKPWWDAGSVTGLSLGDKLFGVNSDMLTMDKHAVSTFVFNKSLMNTYNIEQPYDYARNGTWTLDMLNSQITVVSDDLNGDGEMTSEDRFGLLYQRDTLHDLLVGSGELVGKKDADDYPYVSLNAESAISKLQKMFQILYNRDSCFNVMTLQGDFNVGMNTMFQSNQGLYMWIRMVNIVPLRTMEADFGIIMMPKFDESQDEYYSTVNPYTGVYITVPVSNMDIENTGIFLEAMAYEGYMNVKSAYYDTLLNGIIARDEESSGMLDIIFNSRRYDLGIICDMGDLRSFIYMVMNYDDNVTSYVEKRMKAAQKDIEKLVKALQEE